MPFKRNHSEFVSLAVLSTIVALFASCRKNPTAPVIVPDSRPLITPVDYARINLALVNYDVVHITNRLGANLRSATVSGIAIGSKDSAGFQQLSFAPDSFDANAQAFIIHFDFTVSFDRSQILAPLTIRYYSPDSTYVDVDTTVALYKYPYANAQIIAIKFILPYQQGPFQDISRVGSELYFHPNGPLGLYADDLSSNTTRTLNVEAGGDHIAADSNFVFCQLANNAQVIARFNTIANDVDLEIPFSLDNYGMAIFNGYLYVIDNSYYTYLKKYTLDGTLLDSTNYSNVYNPTYYLAILDSVAYSVGVNHNPVQITRFDLRTKEWLPDVYSPAFECEGIKFFGDTLYYCDYYKFIVGAVPVNNLVVIGSDTQ